MAYAEVMVRGDFQRRGGARERRGSVARRVLPAQQEHEGLPPYSGQRGGKGARSCPMGPTKNDTGGIDDGLRDHRGTLPSHM